MKQTNEELRNFLAKAHEFMEQSIRLGMTMPDTSTPPSMDKQHNRQHSL